MMSSAAFIERAEDYYPSFKAHIHWPRCVHCRKDIPAHGFSRPCNCGACVYCSFECRNNDRVAHQNSCVDIQGLNRAVKTTLIALGGLSSGGISQVFNDHYRMYKPSKMSQAEFDARITEIDRAKCRYFDGLEKLIKQLIREGNRQRGEGSKNELAFEIALGQSMDLVERRRHCDMLFQNHIYLLTGRLQESHTLSCYLASKGSGELKDEELSMLKANDSVPERKFIRHHNYTKSYFRYGERTGQHFVNFVPDGRGYTNWRALLHMFLVKYFLHMDKANLSTIDGHFLNDTDCTNLIGEYMGMKREWITSARGYFSNQAFEILRLFHVHENYFGEAGTSGFYFQEATELADDCYPDDVRRLLVSAIGSARVWMDDARKQQILRASMPSSRWTKIIKIYEQDHHAIYTASVRPYLPWLIKKVNEMAGYDVLGMNMDADLSVTKFFAEADRASCNSHRRMFSQLYDDPISEIADSGHKDFNGLVPMKNNGSSIQDDFFTRHRAIMMCVMIEAKLAQLHFHQICNTEQAKKILDQIPEDSYSLDPPNKPQNGKESGEINDFQEINILHEPVIWCASEWIPTVNNTVDALFEAGLATETNLSVLFGRSDFVSYRVWTIKREKAEEAQMSIIPFVARRRPWKEGCIDNDKRLGLRIKYLNRSDRRDRFTEMTNLGTLGNAIHLVAPSIDQFVARFGWGDLDLKNDAFFREFSSTRHLSEHENERSDEPNTKRCKHELDDFATAADACRHFFDTSSLEEAIWDYVGVPRLIALGADRSDMEELGWKDCGMRVSLGDKAVQIGCRVVHVCSGWCTAWKERKPLED